MMGDTDGLILSALLNRIQNSGNFGTTRNCGSLDVTGISKEPETLNQEIRCYSKVREDCETISDIITQRRPIASIEITDEAEVKKQYSRLNGCTSPTHLRGIYIPKSNLSLITIGQRYHVILAIGHEEGHAAKPEKQNSELDALASESYWYDTLLGLNSLFPKYSEHAIELIEEGIVLGNFYDDVKRFSPDSETIQAVETLRRMRR